MKWHPIGPGTWRIGTVTVYRALLPEPIFFVTHEGKQTRCESRDECLALIERLALQ